MTCSGGELYCLTV